MEEIFRVSYEISDRFTFGIYLKIEANVVELKKSRLAETVRRNQYVIRFCLLFGVVIVLFALLFHRFQYGFAFFYMKPVSYVASVLLGIFGVEAPIDETHMGNGFCDMLLGNIRYRITHGCTGLFPSSLFLAAVLAYPARVREKLVGIIMGIPAFLTFGIIRLIVMAVVALTLPRYIPLLHVYVMAVVNLAFAIFIWMYWINRVVAYEDSDPVSE